MLTATLTVNANIVPVISPEAERSLPRTSASISVRGDEADIHISASDTTAMRAALNSYIGWIKIAQDIEKITR